MTESQNWKQHYSTFGILSVSLYLVSFSILVGGILFQNLWLVWFGLILILGGIWILNIKIWEWFESNLFLTKEAKDFEEYKKRLVYFEIEVDETLDFKQSQYADFFSHLDSAFQKFDRDNPNLKYNKPKEYTLLHVNYFLQNSKLITVISFDQRYLEIFRTYLAINFKGLRCHNVNDPLATSLCQKPNDSVAATCIGFHQFVLMLYLPLPWPSQTETPLNKFFGYLDSVLQKDEKVVLQYIFEFGKIRQNYQQKIFSDKRQSVYSELQITDDKTDYQIFLETLYPKVADFHQQKYDERQSSGNALVATSARCAMFCNKEKYEEVEKILEKAIFNLFWDCNMEKIYVTSTSQVAYNDKRKSFNSEIDFVMSRYWQIPNWMLLVFKKPINMLYYYKENTLRRNQILRTIQNQTFDAGWNPEFTLVDRDFASSIFQFPTLYKNR